jgi:hypothetical protein
VSAPGGRREHHRAPNTPRCGVHAAFTALLKAGVKRRTEVEKHDSAPRIAGPGLHPSDQALRAHTLLEQSAIRRFPEQIAHLLVVRAFHFARVLSF